MNFFHSPTDISPVSFIHLFGIIISFTGTFLSYISLHPPFYVRDKKHNNLLACCTYVKHFSTIFIYHISPPSRYFID